VINLKIELEIELASVESYQYTKKKKVFDWFFFLQEKIVLVV